MAANGGVAVAPKRSTPKITVTNVERIKATTATPTTTTTTKAKAEPKSPDCLTPLVAKKSLTSMTDDEIIQENLKAILDKKSREERKANGRLGAVILAFLVIFLALYHAWISKKGSKRAALAGMLVPAGIMLFYGAWVVILAKRDKHKRALFERHIEEVAQKNKTELEQKHLRLKQADALEQSGSGRASLQYVNELTPGGEHRKKKPRRHRQRQRERDANAGEEIAVHRSGGAKRPSFRQKLFGQNIAHVKLVEVHTDSVELNETEAATTAAAAALSEKRKRLQRMDTLPMPQVVRMSSMP